MELLETGEGVILPVQAQPGARQNGVTGAHDGRLKVSVTQAPEKGKANKALVEVLAKSLGLKKSQVVLLSGETSSQKKFLIQGLARDELAGRIARLLN
ncbi:MAG TPA: YggU family protein [Planctomycetaceae bacterium]|nr:YggU family protein [Planctomycetaceae bacterium]